MFSGKFKTLSFFSKFNQLLRVSDNSFKKHIGYQGFTALNTKAQIKSKTHQLKNQNATSRRQMYI